MPEPGDLEHRIDGYFAAIIKIARYGALSGKTGSFSDVASAAEKASRRWRTTGACHPALHAHFQEFVIWGQVLRAWVLPDRHEMLAAAIHDIGAEEAGDDAADITALLEVMYPQEHAGTSASARQKPSLSEFTVLTQLQDAERRGSASALQAALRSTVLLAERLGQDADAVHPKCQAWSVLTARWVLIRALWETMSNPHRSVLARMVQLAYFSRHGAGEPEPRFLQQAPEIRVPQDADPRWPFLPAWAVVPNVQHGEDPLDPGPDLHLIDGMELSVRQGIVKALGRKQEVVERLACLVTGAPASDLPSPRPWTSAPPA